VKVKTAEVNVLGSQGVEKTVGFNIRASAQAFKLLSSGLYSDKIRAVLREIGCNAYDAHVESDCTARPIRVKLPNTLDSQFYVQDWGPGMSEEDVMSLYSTYFASTKQDSNESTGAFGLGSKSPFAYTNSYNVVSVHGGRKRTYVIYLNNTGEPTTSLMSEEDRDKDWEHGVRVGFAVKPEHYEEFKNKAQEVFQYFRTLPEVKGSTPIEAVKYRHECDDYALTEKFDDTTSRYGAVKTDAYATMGNVRYPIKLEDLKIVNPDSGGDAHDDVTNYLVHCRGLEIRLAIGDAEVVMSRESFEYTPETVKVLREKIRLILARIGKETMRSMDVALSGGWNDICEAKKNVDAFLSGSGRWKFGQFAAAMGVASGLVKEYIKFIDGKTVSMPLMAGRVTAAKWATTTAGRGGRTSPRPMVWSIRDGTNSFGDSMHILIDPDIAIAIGQQKHAMSRAKQAVTDGMYKQLIVLGTGTKYKPTMSQIRDEADEVSRELKGVKIISIDDLPAYEAPVRLYQRKKGKNWKPTLDPQQPVVVHSIDTLSGSSTLGDVPCKVFMCATATSAWGNVKHKYRFMESPNTHDDRVMDSYHWDRVWSHYTRLVEHLAGYTAPMTLPRAYAKVSSQEVRRLYLKDLGWRTMYDAIKDVLSTVELRDTLRKAVSKVKPEAPATFYKHSGTEHGWMSMLSFMIAEGKLSSACRQQVEGSSVWPTIDDMVKERGRGKSANKSGVPEVVVHFEQLCSLMNVSSLGTADVTKGLTADDMDRIFQRQFPLSNMVNIGDVADQITTNTNDSIQVVADTLQFIFSKEVKT